MKTAKRKRVKEVFFLLLKKFDKTYLKWIYLTNFQSLLDYPI